MANSISEEELQLRKRARRRLIGAIALVTIFAVFLPMVLDHEPKPVNQDISIQIPSPNTGAFTSKIVPVTPGAPDEKTVATPTVPSAASTPVYDAEAAPPKKAVLEAAKQQPKPVAVSVAQPPPAKSTPAPAKADVSDAGSYVVQVAALNDAGKARQIQEQITAAGVKSYTEVVPTKSGNVTRIRAGPFGSRTEAEKVRDKLKEMGLSGNIVPK